jgi:hypothetical protein
LVCSEIPFLGNNNVVKIVATKGNYGDVMVFW